MPSNGWDPLVVATRPLSEFMTLWVMQWGWDDDYERGNSRANRVAMMSPIGWLSEETGLDERSIRRVINQETKFTVLDLAEKLCMAVGRPDLLAPGGLLEVVPNPMWNRERWNAWYAERMC